MDDGPEVPPPLTINSLPDELLSRIFTVGCEKNLEGRTPSQEMDFFPFVAEPPFLDEDPEGEDYASGRRRPKPFTRAAMLVCRRWCGIAMTLSNAHLWTTRIGLTCHSKDIAVDFTKFLSALDGSRGSDLDVKIYFPSSSKCSPLVSHALTRLNRHKSQLKGMIFHAGSFPLLFCVFRFLLNIGGASRLEWVRIQATSVTRDEKLALHVRETISLHPSLDRSLKHSRLPVSFPSLCHFVSVPSWQPFFLIPTGPALEYLSIWDLAPDDTAELYWPELVVMLETSPSLKKLFIDLSIMKQMPTLESLSSEARFSVCSLTELQIKASARELFTLFAGFDFPSLEWLQMVHISSKDRSGLNREGELILELPLLKRLTWYSHSDSTVMTFRTVHSPRLRSLDLAAFNPSTAHVIFKQVTCAPIPSDIQIRCYGPQSSCAVLGSGAELTAIASLTFSRLGRSTSQGDYDASFNTLHETLELPNVICLSFHDHSWEEIEGFLNRLMTPQLGRIDRYVSGWGISPYLTYRIIPPLLEGTESLVHRIREIEIQSVSAQDDGLKLLKNVEKVKLTSIEPGVFGPLSRLSIPSSGHTGGYPISFAYMPILKTLAVSLDTDDKKRLVEVEEELMWTYQLRRDGVVPLTRVTIDTPNGRKMLKAGSGGTLKFEEVLEENVL